jgi:hypothetical protein
MPAAHSGSWRHEEVGELLQLTIGRRVPCSISNFWCAIRRRLKMCGGKQSPRSRNVKLGMCALGRAAMAVGCNYWLLRQGCTHVTRHSQFEVLMAIGMAKEGYGSCDSDPYGSPQLRRRIFMCVILHTHALQIPLPSSDIENRHVARFINSLKHNPSRASSTFVKWKWVDNAPPPRTQDSTNHTNHSPRKAGQCLTNVNPLQPRARRDTTYQP